MPYKGPEASQSDDSSTKQLFETPEESLDVGLVRFLVRFLV